MTTPVATTPGASPTDASDGPDEPMYQLTLYVSGASDLSGRAIANARSLCDTHLADCHRLLVVDVHEDVAALLSSRVLATPTLVKHLPLPERKVIGDLSRTDKVLAALGLPDSDNTTTTVH